MELRHLRYFIATAEELHFRRAAERLGIAQPALSRAIQDLEADLGVVLLLRTNRSVQITEAGKTFLEGSREVLGSIERATNKTRQVYEGRAGTLRIGYTDMAIAGVLPRLLKSFQEEHPDITLRPQQGPTVAQLKRLNAGEIDIGFVTGPINKIGYDERCVQTERFVCVVSDTHRLATRKSVRLSELADEDFVHGNRWDWEHFYNYLLPQCRRAGFVPRVVQEGFNTAGILGMVACGMGVTILTDTVRATLGTELRAIDIDDAPDQLLTMALWGVNSLQGPARFFVDFIQGIVEPTA